MTVRFDPAPSRTRRFAFATQVVPAVLYAGAVFYTGLMHMPQLPEVGFVATDKLLHTSVFGGLALLIALALHGLWLAAAVWKKLALGAVGSSVLGLLLELCQSFVPYRSADIWDWVADTLGAVLAAGLGFVTWRWWQRARD